MTMPPFAMGALYVTSRASRSIETEVYRSRFSAMPIQPGHDLVDSFEYGLHHAGAIQLAFSLSLAGLGPMVDHLTG